MEDKLKESKNYPIYYFSPPTQTMLLIVALTAMPGKSMNSTALAGMFTILITWQARSLGRHDHIGRHVHESRCHSLGLQQNFFVLNTLRSIDGDEFPLQLFVDLFNITPSNSEPNTESAHHIPDWLNSMMFSFASHCNEATFNI